MFFEKVFCYSKFFLCGRNDSSLNGLHFLSYPGLSLRIEDAARGKMAKLPIDLILCILLGLLSPVEERFTTTFPDTLSLNGFYSARRQWDWSESWKISGFDPLMSPDGGAFRNLATAKWSKRYFPVKSCVLKDPPTFIHPFVHFVANENTRF